MNHMRLYRWRDRAERRGLHPLIFFERPFTRNNDFFAEYDHHYNCVRHDHHFGTQKPS
jgi:hypothetical protein